MYYSDLYEYVGASISFISSQSYNYETFNIFWSPDKGLDMEW